MIDLAANKGSIINKITEIEDKINIHNTKINSLEFDMNNNENIINTKYSGLLTQITDIYESFMAKIISGKIFTDEILDSVISAYKSGFIEFLPAFYSETQVASRVKEIEQDVI